MHIHNNFQSNQNKKKNQQMLEHIVQFCLKILIFFPDAMAFLPRAILLLILTEEQD